MPEIKERKEELIAEIFEKLTGYASRDVKMNRSCLRNLRYYELEAVRALVDDPKKLRSDVKKPKQQRNRGGFPKTGKYKKELMDYVDQWEHELPKEYIIPYMLLETLTNYLGKKGRMKRR
jgi:hypothetical protein